MSARLACNWVREELISRALHRIATPADRLAEEEANWEAAVAEVDELLEPESVSVQVEEFDPWSDPEWVAAMGGEVAGVS